MNKAGLLGELNNAESIYSGLGNTAAEDARRARVTFQAPAFQSLFQAQALTEVNRGLFNAPIIYSQPEPEAEIPDPLPPPTRRIELE
jgi:hypothetical protein